ncbi:MULTISPECIES: hypothetical protein [Psychrobacter]|uniref:hypothetical protein n=1 Tax=Psychrobacter TaxID=497 RepID=UPI000EEB8E6C|nr:MULTISPECIES: hypothetical protein [Psychrobacter]HCH27011.1 hypothetical protein [Psychrobacter sp.]
MTMVNKQGVLMDRWFKTPNAVVDDITGDVISPQAATILNSIIRFTEGMQGREWAQIPHAFFMRKTRAKRRETIGKYIKELTDQDLVRVQKSNGKTTIYAINWKSPLWYQTPSVEVKTSTDEPYRLKRTSTDEVKEPVRTNRTAFAETSTDEPYTYKDSKDINKDNIYTSGNEKNDDVISVMKNNAQSILDWQPPSKETMQAELVRAGSVLNMSDDQYQIYVGDFKGHFEQNALKGKPLLGDRNRKNRLRQWLENIAKKQPKKSNVFQGNNNAINQSANSQHQQQPNHFDQLRAEAAAKYGTGQQPRDIRTVGSATGHDDQYV